MDKIKDRGQWATDEERRWSNNYLHVEQIADPKMRLRSLRTMLAGELAMARRDRRDLWLARQNRSGWSPNKVLDARIASMDARIAVLRKIAKELR